MSQRRSGNARRSVRSNRSNSEDEVNSSLEDAVKECVRFLVCREGSKIPIKRLEINKHLSTVCQTAGNQVNAVIVEANRILKRVYGYKLVQVEGRSGGIHYIVVLNEECQSLPPTVINPLHRRLLVAALLHIYMSGGPVKDDEMWKFLAEANLLKEEDHAGRRILTSVFNKQMYLSFHKDGEGDLARNVFEWGQRAVEEVPKMFLLNKMAEAFEKTPEHWCEQHREATEGTTEAQES